MVLHANAQGKLDVAGAVGVGFMNVIKDMGMKEPYVGQTVLQTSEIAEDLTYYFATSEQVPSSVGLGVLMEKRQHCETGRRFYYPAYAFHRGSSDQPAGGKSEKVTSVTALLEEGHTPESLLELCWKDLILNLTTGSHSVPLQLQQGESGESSDQHWKKRHSGNDR